MEDFIYKKINFYIYSKLFSAILERDSLNSNRFGLKMYLFIQNKTLQTFFRLLDSVTDKDPLGFTQLFLNTDCTDCRFVKYGKTDVCGILRLQEGGIQGQVYNYTHFKLNILSYFHWLFSFYSYKNEQYGKQEFPLNEKLVGEPDRDKERENLLLKV